MLISISKREGIIMARPRLCRIVGCLPDSQYFKPRRIPLSAVEEINLKIDEFEAIRLADLGGLYQDQAAEKMNISRQTFGRIIESAHGKVAEALVKGKALKIEGGNFEVDEMRKFKCYDCQQTWELPHRRGRPDNCPSCRSVNVHRTKENKGHAMGGCRGVGLGRGCRRMQQK
jgi:uncharacterized protein